MNKYLDSLAWVAGVVLFLLVVTAPLSTGIVTYAVVRQHTEMFPAVVASGLVGAAVFVLTIPNLPGESNDA